ncbi:DEAD/DEAH box helicase [Hydrogenophaga sp.]|uniref:DEAD/DEAH box helicase n=1 Tax=Hydrogenophaga sp. TaxID=1904254 RepID=UPI0025BF461C|nr:DEAD/DEAH box helicase [Hydrogenophaga sp.]MBT9467115.1 DEAD/DEAH box helicase [Hydrogenophaga sp.]
MRDFDPRPWQPSMIDHAINNPRCALFAGMGVGKGVSALSALDAVSLVDDVYPALVLGTLRVARKVWSTEAGKWSHLKHLRVQKIIGSSADRATALRQSGDLFTLNYENLPWLIDRLGEDWPFKTVIADESTRLKNFRLKQGGKRAQALGKIAHAKVHRWINLTGTPSPNGLRDLWGQTWFLDKGHRLGLTFSGFEQRWFAYKRRQDAITKKVEIVPVIMPTADREIHERIHDICLSVDLADYVDLQKPIYVPVKVELPPKARALYRDMERDMFIALAGHEVEAVNAASKTIKCLQLANGAVYVDPVAEGDGDRRAREFVEVHDRKLEALGDIIGDAGGMPVIVAYQFKSDLTRLLKAFPQGRALQTEQDEDDFKAGRIPVLFAHPASAGHGIDGFQDVTNIMVFFGHWWDLELRDQIIGRIGPVRQMQSGHDRPVFIYDIVAEDTIDELVLARHDTKRSVQDLLLDAMKRKVP